MSYKPDLYTMYERYHKKAVEELDNDYDDEKINEQEYGEKFDELMSYEEFKDGYADKHREG